MTRAPVRVLIDTNFLIEWKGRAASTADKKRADRLVSELGALGAVIVIPTPVIAEFLVKAATTDIETMHVIASNPGIVIGSFDYKAALTLHLLDRAARTFGDKRDGIEAPWQKIKTDRQIVAIAHAQRCDLIVTSDHSLRSNALRAGIRCCGVDDLNPSIAVRRHPLSVNECRQHTLSPPRAIPGAAAAAQSSAQLLH